MQHFVFSFCLCRASALKGSRFFIQVMSANDESLVKRFTVVSVPIYITVVLQIYLPTQPNSRMLLEAGTVLYMYMYEVAILLPLLHY